MVVARRLGDLGFAYLSDLTRLELLSVSGTQITDAGVGSLTGLWRLKVLCAERTGLTQTGVTTLNKALPGCKIVQ
jgi:hypothetical protein